MILKVTSSDYGKGCVLLDFTKNTPRPLWENKNMASHISSFVYVDGYIYGNHGSARNHKGEFRCIEMKTGNIMWTENQGIGSLIAVGDMLILLSEKGKVSIAEINPHGYKEIASTQLPRGLYWTPPVLAGKLLFIRNHAGKLFCIDAG